MSRKFRDILLSQISDSSHLRQNCRTCFLVPSLLIVSFTFSIEAASPFILASGCNFGNVQGIEWCDRLFRLRERQAAQSVATRIRPDKGRLCYLGIEWHEPYLSIRKRIGSHVNHHSKHTADGISWKGFSGLVCRWGFDHQRFQLVDDLLGGGRRSRP